MSVKTEEKSYAERQALRYTKNYTNEHICRQISENSTMFSIILGMLIVALVIIILCFIKGFYIAGLVIGIPIIVFAGVGIHEFESLNMIKHIRPACSGKRYSAKEIDELANDPETIWLREAAVFFTPKGLIGINTGITVVDFEDIVGIDLKGKHHMKKTTNGANRGRMSAGRAAHYAITDQYDEWDTYYVKIKTRNHRRLVLTEVAYKGDTDRLIQIWEERRVKL